MIRAAAVSDTESILEVWLSASIAAHGFVDRSFWESKINDMREIYLPSSETYVYDDTSVRGFFSLSGDFLAAMFVSPHYQGKGIGQQLMLQAMQLRDQLSLNVYEENTRAVQFYAKFGFLIVQRRIDSETGRNELVMKLFALQSS